jgi:hypothetical protein
MLRIRDDFHLSRVRVSLDGESGGDALLALPGGFKSCVCNEKGGRSIRAWFYQLAGQILMMFA